jgi:hypothetical protein
VSHYEVLAVAPTAPPSEIRAAYRRAARAAHPDRHGAGSAARMAAVNEAWRVLGDPALRRAYDQQLADLGGPRPSAARGGSAAGAPFGHGSATSAPPMPVTPAKVPWRFMISMAVAGIAVLVVGRIFTSPSDPAAPDNILRAGDCVTLSVTLEASEVVCSGPYDAVVRSLVPFDQLCPTGTESYRDRQGMGNACVERATP